MINAHDNRGFTLVELLVGIILFGVTALAVSQVLIGGGKTTKTNMAATTQNSMLRAAAELIRTDLAASEQFVEFDQVTVGSNMGGNSITFVKKVPDGSGGWTYIPERIAFRGSTETNEKLRYTVTVQQGPRSAKTAAVTYASTSANWTTAPSRVLVNKATSSSSQPLFMYFEKATTRIPSTATALSVLQDTQLVDLNLRRDEDVNPANSAASEVSDAETNKTTPTARLETSIYLTGTASQGRGNNGDQVMC
jgi:prepilin-type N-terminal cleavage/methylation domain-containing protein